MMKKSILDYKYGDMLKKYLADKERIISKLDEDELNEINNLLSDSDDEVV